MQLMRQAGMTLVELAVAVAIVAIGAALAAPAISRMIANYKVREAADSLMSGLNLARAEAVRRNTRVAFALSGSQWTITLVDNNTQIAESPAGQTSGLVVTSQDQATVITFLPNGAVDSTAASPRLSEVTIAAKTDATARSIKIFGGGIIRMCDPSRTTPGDPRMC